MSLRVSDFDYALDPRLIAQAPRPFRDQSRLMVIDRATGARRGCTFHQIAEVLEPGDLLVLNDTRVVPARFFCQRPTCGRIEGLFLREVHVGKWQVMLRGAGRCRLGERLKLQGSLRVSLILRGKSGEGCWSVELDPPEPAQAVLEKIGTTPLPPYIRWPGPVSDAQDRESYQTVYAARPGAVAAPTAGLHFTAGLLDSLKACGVELVHLTLHVGLGTFQPVKVDMPADHKMHAEWYELTCDAAEKLNAARDHDRRIVAAGTTSVRVLETLAAAGDRFEPASGWTDIFIHPPAEFRATDALITNFHLPRSTLLMLVAAFCSPGRTEGVRMILDAYAEAMREGYSFYSYGDAMLIT